MSGNRKMKRPNNQQSISYSIKNFFTAPTAPIITPSTNKSTESIDKIHLAANNSCSLSPVKINECEVEESVNITLCDSIIPVEASISNLYFSMDESPVSVVEPFLEPVKEVSVCILISDLPNTTEVVTVVDDSPINNNNIQIINGENGNIDSSEPTTDRRRSSRLAQTSGINYREVSVKEDRSLIFCSKSDNKTKKNTKSDVIDLIEEEKDEDDRLKKVPNKVAKMGNTVAPMPTTKESKKAFFLSKEQKLLLQAQQTEMKFQEQLNRNREERLRICKGNLYHNISPMLDLLNSPYSCLITYQLLDVTRIDDSQQASITINPFFLSQPKENTDVGKCSAGNYSSDKFYLNDSDLPQNLNNQCGVDVSLYELNNKYTLLLERNNHTVLSTIASAIQDNVQNHIINLCEDEDIFSWRKMSENTLYISWSNTCSSSNLSQFSLRALWSNQTEVKDCVVHEHFDAIPLKDRDHFLQANKLLIGNNEGRDEIQSWLGQWAVRRRIQNKVDLTATNNNDNIGTNKKTANKYDDYYNDDDEDNVTDEELANLLIIQGPSGSGKTAVVYSVAKSEGFNVLELNGSHNRNGATIKKMISEAVQSHVLGVSSNINNIESVFGGNDVNSDNNLSEEISNRHSNLILLDEADIIFDEEDTNFYATIVQLAKISKCPIVLTTEQPLKQLNNAFPKIIIFNKPSPTELTIALTNYYQQGGFKEFISPLKFLSYVCDGDVRAAAHSAFLLLNNNSTIISSKNPIIDTLTNMEIDFIIHEELKSKINSNQHAYDGVSKSLISNDNFIFFPEIISIEPRKGVLTEGMVIKIFGKHFLQPKYIGLVEDDRCMTHSSIANVDIFISKHKCDAHNIQILSDETIELIIPPDDYLCEGIHQVTIIIDRYIMNKSSLSESGKMCLRSDVFDSSNDWIMLRNRMFVNSRIKRTVSNKAIKNVSNKKSNSFNANQLEMTSSTGSSGKSKKRLFKRSDQVDDQENDCLSNANDSTQKSDLMSEMVIIEVDENEIVPSNIASKESLLRKKRRITLSDDEDDENDEMMVVSSEEIIVDGNLNENNDINDNLDSTDKELIIRCTSTQLHTYTDLINTGMMSILSLTENSHLLVKEIVLKFGVESTNNDDTNDDMEINGIDHDMIKTFISENLYVMKCTYYDTSDMQSDIASSSSILSFEKISDAKLVDFPDLLSFMSDVKRSICRKISIDYDNACVSNDNHHTACLMLIDQILCYCCMAVYGENAAKDDAELISKIMRIIRCTSSEIDSIERINNSKDCDNNNQSKAPLIISAEQHQLNIILFNASLYSIPINCSNLINYSITAVDDSISSHIMIAQKKTHYEIIINDQPLKPLLSFDSSSVDQDVLLNKMIASENDRSESIKKHMNPTCAIHVGHSMSDMIYETHFSPSIPIKSMRVPFSHSNNNQIQIIANDQTLQSIQMAVDMLCDQDIVSNMMSETRPIDDFDDYQNENWDSCYYYSNCNNNLSEPEEDEFYERLSNIGYDLRSASNEIIKSLSLSFDLNSFTINNDTQIISKNNLNDHNNNNNCANEASMTNKLGWLIDYDYDANAIWKHEFGSEYWYWQALKRDYTRLYLSLMEESYYFMNSPTDILSYNSNKQSTLSRQVALDIAPLFTKMAYLERFSDHQFIIESESMQHTERTRRTNSKYRRERKRYTFLMTAINERFSNDFLDKLTVIHDLHAKRS
eukprot:gene8395-11353_t